MYINQKKSVTFFLHKALQNHTRDPCQPQPKCDMLEYGSFPAQAYLLHALEHTLESDTNSGADIQLSDIWFSKERDSTY